MQDYSEQQTISPLLFSFISEFKFNSRNLNSTNHYGTTPITLAIEKNQQDILLELLRLKANPLIENIHGNTPLSLSKGKPFYLQTIEQAIEPKVCGFLDCDINKYFCYDGKQFKINKLVLEGSCCLVAFELQDCNTLLTYFAKVKTNFGGLEVRNYIFLQQYIDLFMIRNLHLSFEIHGKKANITKKNVYCMIVKFISGQALTVALNCFETEEQRQRIIIATITALTNLHTKGYIHNDALPNNCFWDHEKQIATFIDYDIMRTKQDMLQESDEDFEQAKYYDFERLIIGDISNVTNKQITYGLSYYIKNINNILLDLDDAVLSPKIKNKLVTAAIC